MNPRTRRRTLAAVTVPVLAVLAAVLALPLLAPTPQADACGPYFPEPLFWPDDSTGVPWERMVGGELGILDRGVALRELWIAYRHLAGPPLTAADRGVLSSFDAWQPGSGGWPRTDSWSRLRQQLTWIEPMPRAYYTTSRVESRELPNGGIEKRYVLNCLTDAFETATATLEARIGTWGADSPEVAEWVRGQDQVFANCGGGETLPDPLGYAWPLALRQDRDYQVAAAHFYSLHYAEAERLFRAIGDDTASPWRHLARYLVARAQARDRRWDEAVETLRALVDDPAQALRRASIRGLIDHYRARSVPAELHAEKRRALLASPLPAGGRQVWTDFEATFASALYADAGTRSAAGADLDRWLAAFARPESLAPTVAPTDALAVWRAEPSSRHWRVAALVSAEPAAGAGGVIDPLDDLLAAAAAVDPAAPEAATVAFHRARLLLGLDRGGEALEVIDDLLSSATELPGAARNRVQAMRADLADDLDGYLHWSQMQPVALTVDGSYWPSWNDEPAPVLLTDEAAHLLDRLTVEELATVVETTVLEAELRRRLAATAWTRAVLLADGATAERLAPLVGRLIPELAPAMERYLAAAGDERRFVAVLALLRHPGMTAALDVGLPRREALTELDGLRRNWWCAHPALSADGPLRLPSFFTADPQRNESRARAVAALSALPSGPVILGDLAIDWADAHRRDPRVPEALHRVVRATRYGCTGYDEDVGAVSQDAFVRLHRRYPDSEWTTRTPYWFE